MKLNAQTVFGFIGSHLIRLANAEGTRQQQIICKVNQGSSTTIGVVNLN